MGAHAHARAVDPGADGADGHVQRAGDLLVGERRPRVQQQRVAIAGTQRPQHGRELRAELLGLDAVERVGDRVGWHVMAEPLRRAGRSGAAAEPAPQQVRGDPVEPWRGVVAAVVAPALVERDAERLGGDVLGPARRGSRRSDGSPANAGRRSPRTPPDRPARAA